MAEVRLHNLTVSYQRHPAVHHLSGVFLPGSLTAVIGPNGAGKSTLLKTLAGLERPESGGVEWQGVDPRQIAYLPQQAQIDRSFPMTVAELVQLGLWRQRGWFGRFTATDRLAVRHALQQVGLAGFEQRTLAALSIGQFQRALFARLMLQDAPLVLLDEPFAALDYPTTADLLALVGRWHAAGRTIIAVVHDFQQVAAHFPQSLLLARSLVAWGDTATVLTPEHLQQARHMAEAWNETAPVCLQP